MPDETPLGMEAELSFKVGGVAAGGDYTVLDNCTDVTMNLEKGSADVSTRANNGWRAKKGTLKDLSIEFQMIDDPSDDGFAAIQAAFFSGDNIGIMCLDGPAGNGIEADMQVMSFSRSEPLEDAVKYSVKLEIGRSDTPPEWHEAS